MEQTKAEAVIEAVLFTMGESVEISRLAEVIETDVKTTKKILKKMAERYEEEDRGIVLTGGGALLRGLEELIEEKTGINTMTAEDPMKVVAIGTGQYVEFMNGKKDF